MSFNGIILPKTAIAEIYKDNLVEIILMENKQHVKDTVHAIPKPTHTIQYLGKNLKRILILVHYPEVVHLPEEQLEFLSKILIACKLDIGDIAVINTAREQANEENLRMLKAESVLLFGECVSNILDDKETDFFLPVYGKGIAIMTAPALEKLFMTTNESKQLKSKLWLSLQQFFKLQFTTT